MAEKKVNKASKKDIFISDCMSKCKGDDHEQNVAICFSKWKESQKSLAVKKLNKSIKSIETHIEKIKQNDKILTSKKAGLLYNINKSLSEILDIHKSRQVNK